MAEGLTVGELRARLAALPDEVADWPVLANGQEYHVIGVRVVARAGDGAAHWIDLECY